ncbi:GAF and ANTAR domain-containing protein [Amycolatopsis regifaucium]|uniref:Transcriptional regulator n=1 Tax=Amycolatopsis regifaucium TaxID=546365 RepID=A0A154M8T7_9PSEU|nr:GAF and ANTAR domain-containing protein [Amycolatopsis regifaucium]KZB81058.1 transcriptional regulator [Amycolatopsis regifaucium]OKA04783.1 transcriptional regulator [Amycolatopsis regifaucium]SFJ71309.1 GAF domain-containing protein [Amycolatopsis regifaucium]
MDAGREEAWPVVLDDVGAALETLSSALDSAEDFAVLLNQVCRQVNRAVPGVDGAAITLLTDGKPVTVATTSETVAELDRNQYSLGDGPCLRAALTGTLVRVSIADAAERWPVFAKESAAAGFDSFLSAPLVVNDAHSGAVNCYSARSHGFAELDEKLLHLYTRAVTAALRAYTRYQQAQTNAEELRKALTSRGVIDQAKGILMVLRQVSADEAFALLVEQSQRENVKLREVAVRFITRATGVRPAP